MKEEFVSYEIAKRLKEKGFKEKCVSHYFGDEFNYNISQFRGVCLEDFMMSFNTLCRTENLYPSYHKCVDAPTISQVLEWLREEKNIYVIPIPYPSMSTKDKVVWCYQIKHNSDGAFVETVDGAETYMFYRRAALEGIEYVIDKLI